MFDLVCKRITEQQENASLAVRALGSQLKDILRKLGPEACDIVLKDLDKPEMSLSECEKEIHAYADELHKKYKGASVCVTGDEAERIIKEFYGIDALNSQAVEKINTSGGFLDLADFL